MKLKLIAMIIWGTALASAATITPYTDEAAFIAATGAGPISPTVTGYATPITDGYAFDLWNLPGAVLDRTVLLTFDNPLIAFGATWDNLPYQVGTGIELWTGGQQVAEFGAGLLIQGFYGIVSDVSFDTLKLKTNMAFDNFRREHGTMVNLLGSDGGGDQSGVPEPGTWALVGAGLVAIGIARRRG